MITIKVKTIVKQSSLEKEIEKLFLLMSDATAGTEEYKALSAQLTELYKLKEQDTPKRLSADKKAEIAAYLLGLGMVLGFERNNIITSKALGFVSKLAK